MTLRRQLQRYGRWLVVIGLFAALAGVLGAYVLVHQRVPLPYQDRYTVHVELTDVAGLTPGLGQPVNVAGVRVGEVGDIALRDGRARVALEIDPAELPSVHAGASAALQARTPLKDLQIELAPGSPDAPRLPPGATIPAARTSVPLNSDDLLGVLDADTRAYLRSLMTATAGGFDGRGRDVRAALKALGPTTAQLRRITTLVGRRRTRVARLVTNLSKLAQATGREDPSVRTLLTAGNQTLAAVGGQDRALRAALAELPGTLDATREALPRVEALARDVRPAARELQPALRALPAGLDSTRKLAERLTPVLRDDVRPLVRSTAPIAPSITTAVQDLAAATPALTNTTRILRYLSNELAHNPEGKEDEGFLFWLSWTAQNINSLLSVDDAHGPTARSAILIGCGSVSDQPGPASELLQAVAGVAPVCRGGG